MCSRARLLGGSAVLLGKAKIARDFGNEVGFEIGHLRNSRHATIRVVTRASDCPRHKASCREAPCVKTRDQDAGPEQMATRRSVEDEVAHAVAYQLAFVEFDRL